MEEKIGLIKKAKCLLKKTDPELIEKISTKTEMEVDMVKEMMGYNMFTVNQFADLAKLSVSHVLNKTRPSVIDGLIGTELDYCYPFRDRNGDGPKFIIRNAKAEKYIKV